MRIIKLFTIALAATGMSIGATALHANLVGDSIYGCALTGSSALTGEALADAITSQCISTGQTAQSTVGGTVEFTKTQASGVKLQADLSTDASGLDWIAFTLTNPSLTASATIGATGITIAGLDFVGGGLLLGLDNESFTTSGLTTAQVTGLGDPAALIKEFGYYDGGPNRPNYDDGYYFVIPIIAANLPKNSTVTFRASLTRGVPEPGSLALLGVVLLALAGVHLKRARLFKMHSTGLAS